MRDNQINSSPQRSDSDNRDIVDEIKRDGIPLSLFHRSGLLILRGVFVSVIQYSCKRYVLAQKNNGELLAASGGMSFLESLNFPLLFSSLYIVQTKVGVSKGDFKKVGELFRQGLVFGGLLMVPVLILSLNAESIFRLTKQPDVVISNSRCYFKVSSVAYLFDTVYRLLVRMAVGVDDFYLGLIGDGVESVVDLTATYVLVNGKYGFPELGVCASAWGYAAGAFAGLLSAIFYACYTKKFEKYELLNFKSAINWDELKEMIESGMHWACSGMLADVTQMLITFVCGLSGHGALIARQVASSYYNMEIFLGDGVLEAGSVLIAPLHTLKEAKLFRDVSYWVYMSVVGFSILSAIFLLSNLSWAAGFFFQPNEVNKDDVETVESFLRIQAFICIASSVMHTFNYLLSGCNKTREPFWLTTGFLFALNSILVGLVYFAFHQGASAAFGVQLVGIILSAAGQGLFWKRELRELNKATSNAVVPVVIAGQGSQDISVQNSVSVVEPTLTEAEMRRTPISISRQINFFSTREGTFFSESPKRADQGFDEQVVIAMPEPKQQDQVSL